MKGVAPATGAAEGPRGANGAGALIGGAPVGREEPVEGGAAGRMNGGAAGRGPPAIAGAAFAGGTFEGALDGATGTGGGTLGRDAGVVAGVVSGAGDVAPGGTAGCVAPPDEAPVSAGVLGSDDTGVGVRAATGDAEGTAGSGDAARSAPSCAFRVMEMTPPQTEHRARTLAAGSLSGSTRKTERHSGQTTFIPSLRSSRRSTDR